MQKAKLDEAQPGTKISGRNINNLKYANDITLMAKNEEGLTKESLDEGERESGKSWLKTQHSKN